MNTYREIRASLNIETKNLRVNEAFIKIKQGNSNQMSFFPGQWINGLVTAVDERISIQIGNQAVSASRDINPQAVPGDWMLFEVLQITDNKIIMALAGSEISEKKALVTLLRPDSDREAFLSRKAQTDKQTEKEKGYKDNRDKMSGIMNRLTEQDYKLLEMEGFSLEDFTISGFEAALGRIKTKSTNNDLQSLNSAEHSESGHRDDLTVEEIKQRLRQANLPVTEENIQKVMTAMNLYKSLQRPDEGTINYLVSKALPPTIGNVYKAQHSNMVSDNIQLTEKAWSELLPQVEELITSAGYEINGENLSQAKGLLEQGLPLTKENYIYYRSLKEFTKPSDHQVLDNLLQDMKEGITPNDTLLTDYNADDVKKMVSKLKELGEREIHETIREDKKLTLKELIYRKQEELPTEEASKKELTTNQQIEAVRALRHLEEIRLKMTVEAASRLERRGYHIETKPLEDVVQELRRLEEEYDRKLLLEADVVSNTERMEILRATKESMEQLKTVPSLILGSTLHIKNQITVPKLLEEGYRLSAELSKANEAYECLMTQPNREYGDSIQKAFHNLTSILEELGLEDTIYNRRAIKILGYNQMEITRESMEEIKAYDLMVNSMMKNLHPAVTVRMIKEGINPLDLSIEELNNTINRIRREQGITEEERFATFLRRLDKENSLVEKERKAYIGIYRLLHSIDKSDGAALGAVIKAGREITLSHLLTAVRSLKKGSIDTKINDQFGALERISFHKERILEQINAAFGNDSETNHENSHRQPDPYQAAKQEFTTNAIKQLLSNLTPGYLRSVQNTANDAGQPLLSSSGGIWEVVKDLPMEQLFDQFLSHEGIEAEEATVYEAKVQELRQIYQKSDQAIRFLEDFKIPSTTTNILLAGEILSGGSTLFKRLRLLQDENPMEKSNISLKERESLADTIIDKESMNEIYEKLEKEVQSVIDNEINSDRIHSKRILELKNIGAQMSLLKTLAKKEFYQIPVETKSGIMNINLTVIRGTNKTGKVTITQQSEKLGKVKADLCLKGNEINGYIACDNRRGCEELQEGRQELDKNLNDENMIIKQLEVCYSAIGKEPYSYQHPEENDKQENMNPKMEQQLYKIAKLVISLLRKVENNTID